MEALRAAQQAALGVGVTAVGDMGEPAWSRGPWQAWRDLEVAMMPTDEAGGLALRVQVRRGCLVGWEGAGEDGVPAGGVGYHLLHASPWSSHGAVARHSHRTTCAPRARRRSFH